MIFYLFGIFIYTKNFIYTRKKIIKLLKYKIVLYDLQHKRNRQYYITSEAINTI